MRVIAQQRSLTRCAWFDMSGYEKSPDYGNPPPLTWQQWLKGGLVIAAVASLVAWAVLR